MARTGSWARASALAVIVLFGPLAARADWLNLTGAETASNIAEIFVFDGHVRVVLEVYVGDLAVFRDLVPDDWIADGEKRPAEPERRAHFPREVLAIVPEGGAPLPDALQAVGGRTEIGELDPWAESARCSKVVAIGRDIDAETLTRLFDACVYVQKKQTEVP